MKKAIYIIFTVFTIAMALLLAMQFIRDYKDYTIKKLDTENQVVNISNSNGSYLILYNPKEYKEGVGATEENDPKSILVTVPFDLKGARYWLLNDFYTSLDYTLDTHEDGNPVTIINLYNATRKEKYTLKFSTTGKALESNKNAESELIDPSDIPDMKVEQTVSPDQSKVSLSKGPYYVEIPEYFKIEEGGYNYSPQDFIQFTDIPNIPTV